MQNNIKQPFQGKCKSKNQSKLAFYGILVVLFLLMCFNESHGTHEHFQSYLDHRDFYMHHFSEMLSRKNEMYQAKYGEYSDRLDNYNTIDHEDTRHHEEADDEQLELNHEQGEASIEDHTHRAQDRRRRRSLPFKRTITDIVQSQREANQFFRPRQRKHLQ